MMEWKRWTYPGGVVLHTARTANGGTFQIGRQHGRLTVMFRNPGRRTRYRHVGFAKTVEEAKRLAEEGGAR